MRNRQALGKMKVRRCWGARAQTSGAGIQRRSARTRSRVGRNIGLWQYGGRRGAMYLPGNAAPRTPIVSRDAELRLADSTGQRGRATGVAHKRHRCMGHVRLARIEER